MEMTDIGGQDKQEQGGANKKRCSDHHGPDRRPSVPRGIGTPNKHVHERHGSSSHGEAFEEDFEEFVLDFDDYDLLESIHTHMETPAEPTRKFLRGPFPVTFSAWRSALPKGECHFKLPVEERSHDGPHVLFLRGRSMNGSSLVSIDCSWLA